MRAGRHKRPPAGPPFMGEPAGPGRPRGGTSPCRFVLSRPPAQLLPLRRGFTARPPRQERQGVRLPGFPQNRPCAFGPGRSPQKAPGKGTRVLARYCPRVAQLPRHTAPARSVPLRPAPRSRPCAARAQQKRTAEKFRRPFERALSASQKLSTGCRASDSWCAAGGAPSRCPACPDTPCRAG